MDLPSQWTLAILKGFLPEPVHAFLYRLKSEVTSALSAFAAQMWPVVAPLVNRVGQALASSPDLVVLVVLITIVVLIVQILAYVQRIMMFWTRLAMRAIFWAGVAAVGAMVWQRGIEVSVRDAIVWGSKVLGFASGVKDVFVSEYQKYEEQERLRGRTAGMGGTGMGAGGGGRGW